MPRPTTKIRQTLGDSNKLSDGTPSQKRIAIEPQTKEKIQKKKKIEKVKKKRKMTKIGICIRISGIIQLESRAQSEGPVKA